MPGFGSLFPALEGAESWLKPLALGGRLTGGTGKTFGSIAPDAAADEDALRQTADLPGEPYYDPGTGLPVGGTDKYQPPAPKPAPTYKVSPDLLGTQLNRPDAYAAAAPNPYEPGTENYDWFERSRVEDDPRKQIARPGVVPLVKTPEGGYALTTPRIADIGQYIVGGAVPEAGGAVFGAGRVRVPRRLPPRPPVEDVPPPPIGHNMPPEEAVLSPQEQALSPPPPAPTPASRSKFVDAAGNAIKGAAYTREAQRIMQEINNGPKGAGPIDLTKQSRMPDVPQTTLPRYDPPQGVSARLQDAFNNPDVLEGLRSGIRAGVAMGADKWYDTGAVRAAFIDELGPVQGDAEFKRYMDNVAATSPRSDVPTNVRNASYYFAHATPADLPEKLPYPYGHVAQNLHRQNFETITSEGGWEPMQNPKPASFAQNLQGNHEPVTADTHAFRAIGMRTNDPRFLETSVSAKYKMGTDPTKDTIVNKYGERKGDTVTFRPQQLFNDGKLTMEDAKKIPYFWAAKPKDNEYGAVEDLYRYLGDEHGLTPAGAQAAGWAGSGELTGLGTVPNKTFPELLNERILFTAKMRGEDPKVTLQNFIRGKKPLLSMAPVPQQYDQEKEKQ